MILSGQTYKCSLGESFDSVSLVIYGDEKYASELLCANPSLCNLSVFNGGEELQIPVVEIPGGSDEEDDEDIEVVATDNTAPWKR